MGSKPHSLVGASGCTAPGKSLGIPRHSVRGEVRIGIGPSCDRWKAWALGRSLSCAPMPFPQEAISYVRRSGVLQLLDISAYVANTRSLCGGNLVLEVETFRGVEQATQTVSITTPACFRNGVASFDWADNVLQFACPGDEVRAGATIRVNVKRKPGNVGDHLSDVANSTVNLSLRLASSCRPAMATFSDGQWQCLSNRCYEQMRRAPSTRCG